MSSATLRQHSWDWKRMCWQFSASLSKRAIPVNREADARCPVDAHRRWVGAFLRKVWAVAAKDLRAELRGREVFSTMTVFSVLAVIIFGMAFDLRVPKAEMVAPGVLWVIILFAGVLGLNRSFGAEMDRGTLPALLLAPVDRSAIYFGKVLANLVFTLVTAALILVVMFFIFDVDMFQPLIIGRRGPGYAGICRRGHDFCGADRQQCVHARACCPSCCCR